MYNMFFVSITCQQQQHTLTEPLRTDGEHKTSTCFHCLNMTKFLIHVVYTFSLFLPAIRSLERRARYLFYCMFVCLFGQRFLSNPRADSRHILQAGVAWVGTCLLPFWGSATNVGAKRGKMTWGWSHSCIGQLPFLFLSAMPNVVQYVRHRPAHILV